MHLTSFSASTVNLEHANQQEINNRLNELELLQKRKPETKEERIAYLQNEILRMDLLAQRSELATKQVNAFVLKTSFPVPGEAAGEALYIGGQQHFPDTQEYFLNQKKNFEQDLALLQSPSNRAAVASVIIPIGLAAVGAAIYATGAYSI
ncbi:MAG: hypothetical protein E6Q59_00955 [Nitrosomonas sp.]|nr:MAG: hypothetical protein E6Q59_00955 [Nitrosomonas sp.]